MDVIGRVLLSAMVCALAGFCMYLTNGQAGIGWGILGLAMLWLQV